MKLVIVSTGVDVVAKTDWVVENNESDVATLKILR